MGLTITDGKVLPIELLDTSELTQLPKDAQQDLVKAIEWFRDGDLSGAVSSACAAIDTVTLGIYKEKVLEILPNLLFKKNVRNQFKL